jgi:hypothetical protein
MGRYILAFISSRSSFGGESVTVFIMSVQNVTVATGLIGSDQSLLESRAILLTQSAIKHLERVGK